MAEISYAGKTYMANTVFELPALSREGVKAFIALSHYKPLELEKVVALSKGLMVIPAGSPFEQAYAEMDHRKGILYDAIKKHAATIDATELFCAAFGRLPENTLEQLSKTSKTFQDFYFNLPQLGGYEFDLSLAITDGKLPDRTTINSYVEDAVTLSHSMRVFPTIYKYTAVLMAEVVAAMYHLFEQDAQKVVADVSEYNIKQLLGQRILPLAINEVQQQMAMAETALGSPRQIFNERNPNPGTKH